MLIPFTGLVEKYNMKVTGVLHIGAHMCEELSDYLAMGVNKDKIVWIEGNPDLVAQNKSVDSSIKIFNYLVSDKDDVSIKFHISNNGQSSSIFELGTHLQEHPQVTYVDSKNLTSTTVETIYKRENLDEKFANFLNIDIQGAELLALKGMGKLLCNFNYLYLEVNQKHLYVGCCLVNEIDDYVKQFGFARVETKWTPHGWGDALYVKN